MPGKISLTCQNRPKIYDLKLLWRCLPCLPDFIIVECLYCILGLLFIGEGHKGVAPIVAIEVHHHPHLIDFANLPSERGLSARWEWWKKTGILKPTQFHWQIAQPGLGISPEMQLWPSVTDQLPSSLTFSQRGISSSSKRSRGSFPMKISQPLSGGGPSQPGGGPPYFLCPFSCRGGKEKKGSCIDF